MTTQNIKELSIQVNLNGLSFCVLNRTDNSIELLEHLPFEYKVTPFKALEALKAYLEQNKLIEVEFSEVTVIHHNELSTFVPKDLFNEKHSADYLKFNSKILQTDFISHDELVINNSVNVYVPYININNFVFDNYGEFTFKHSSTVLVNSILQSKLDLNAPFVYINVNKTSFEFIAVANGKLELYNTFEYTTAEDFIYFVLFTMEQLNYNPDQVKILLSGVINQDDDLYNLLYTYVRYIDFIEEFCSFSSKPNITIDHKNFLLLNSL